jgi:hypothetical protein
MITTFNDLDSLLLQTVDTSNAKYNITSYYTEFDIKKAQMANLPVNITDGEDGWVQPFNVSNIDSIKEYLNEISQMQFVAENIITSTIYSDED